MKGEKFKGVYEEPYTTHKVTWRKIKITENNDKMKTGLEDIYKDFEGKIWKGYQDKILYIKCDNLTRDKSYNFKITWLRLF